jgi:deoxyadenosine/deoxycytidine kinase
MSERDYDAYCRLYRAVSSFLPPPDLIVYLSASVETLVEHIERRGNDYERNIAPDYLRQLNRLYDAWIGDWTACPVIRVEMDGNDFLHNRADLDAIIQQIQSAAKPRLA